MSKVEINNEVVLLGNNAHQARVQLIKKFTRDAAKLREKKGNEQQKAKNQRKADRIVAEILSIKKVKKNKITKHILTNTLNLKEILENEKSKPLTRMMARIAAHKKFSPKFSEFKNKYPNYMEFLGPGKKKSRLEQKEKKLGDATSNESIVSSTHVKDEESDTASDTDVEKSDESSADESNVNNDEQSVSEDEKSLSDEVLSNDVIQEKKKIKDSNEAKLNGTKSNKTMTEQKSTVKKERSKKTSLSKQKKASKNDEQSLDDEEQILDEESNKNSTVKKEKIQKTLLGKRKKASKDEEQILDEESKPKVLKKKTDTSKIISKQAIVKKFTDILKEDDFNSDRDQEISIDSINSNIKIEKEEDPFFVTGDGESNYLSVALPKHKLVEEEDDYNDNDRFNKRKFSRQQNDKFFSKVPKFKNHDLKFNSDKPDSRWEGQHNNSRSYGKERPGNKTEFNNNKFNSERKDTSKSFNKHSKANHEDNSNEKLHPSWAAKKKQQGIIKGVQGKKIVFGDDL